MPIGNDNKHLNYLSFRQYCMHFSVSSIYFAYRIQLNSAAGTAGTM